MKQSTTTLKKENKDTIDASNAKLTSSGLSNEHAFPIPPAASEIKLHIQLAFLIFLLFVIAIGLSYAEHWANPTSVRVEFPSYTVNILKVLEFTLFIAGVCTVVLYLGLAVAVLFFKIATNFLNEKDTFQRFKALRVENANKNSNASSPQSPPPSPAPHG